MGGGGGLLGVKTAERRGNGCKVIKGKRGNARAREGNCNTREDYKEEEGM